MPECELPLCKLAYHLAAAPRDNSVYVAMLAMHDDIKNYGNLAVPIHLRNAPTHSCERQDMERDMSMLMTSQIKKVPKSTFLKSYEGGNIRNSYSKFCPLG